ncbi:MAG: glycosyltransferase, partial [Planctomycetes bacterium]|nr:glycosyltransferase [Planctomycetota bacterium]
MPAFECLYLSLMAVISLYGVHRFWLIWGAKGDAPAFRPALGDGDHFPCVLVQLPVYNETDVVHRLIDAAVALDWPTECLEIQVLDDSTDGSSDEIARTVGRHRRTGASIVHLRRSDRVGYKAGALQAGLEQSGAEYVAIFDADFAPPPGFLRAMLPSLIQDPKVGMAQARWGFTNATTNRLTEIQAALLHGHFDIEHRARGRAGRFFNFNGTAGVWR